MTTSLNGFNGGIPSVDLMKIDIEGQVLIRNLIQDGTGSRTVTWFPTINWAGGSAPTLTTTESRADVIGLLGQGLTL